MTSRATARARGDRNMHAVGVGDAAEAGEPVGDDGRARCDDALRQALHPAALEAGDAAQLDPSRPTLLIGLNGHDNRLLAGTAAPCLTARALTTEVGVVHFHATVEPLAHRDEPHRLDELRLDLPGRRLHHAEPAWPAPSCDTRN